VFVGALTGCEDERRFDTGRVEAEFWRGLGCREGEWCRERGVQRRGEAWPEEKSRNDVERTGVF